MAGQIMTPSGGWIQKLIRENVMDVGGASVAGEVHFLEFYPGGYPLFPLSRNFAELEDATQPIRKCRFRSP